MRPDYVKCIVMEGRKSSLCGRAQALAEFHFIGIDHAYNEHARGGRMQACPECVKEVVSVLKSDFDDREEDV